MPVAERTDLFIEQQYDTYTPAEHESWRRLIERIEPRWERYANPYFREGVQALGLPRNRIPRLADVNRQLAPRTGFQARAVSGYVPAFLFFDCLRRREFPTTVTIRPADRLDYLPEPDIFHDIAGHVPMHTNRAFAEALVRFGDCAHTAVELTAGVRDETERLARLASMIRAMARFFWFTVEFGLMRDRQGIVAYGSGLLSSFGELAHAVDSPDVERRPVAMDEVIHQPFEIDRFQPLLYVVDSLDHLFSLVDGLERAMRAGKLDRVAGGSPEVSETDLRSFLPALEH
jgi:phenylalanine-4-hydroxylase